MADKKISELVELTSLTGTDAFPVAGSGATKRVTFDTLATEVRTESEPLTATTITASGDLTVPNVVIDDGGTIGSASDPDAMSIASGGDVTFTQDVIASGDVTADNVVVSDGGTIGSASDPDAMSIASGGDVTFTQDVIASGDITSNGKTVYHRGNIVGTVSQSGGDPTGAVIERGSNANGEYVKYADGALICYRVFSSDFRVTGAANRDVIDMPAISTTIPSGSVSFTNTANDNLSNDYANTSLATTEDKWYFTKNQDTNGFTTLNIYLSAIGRWY